MQLSSYDRSVIITHDSRYPQHASRVADALRSLGCGKPKMFLNGHRRTVGGISAPYDYIHDGDPPSWWEHKPNAWHYANAYRAILSRALSDDIETLLVAEDDIEFTPNTLAIMERARVPDNWQMLYHHTFRQWEEIRPESAGPYLIRLNGGQPGFQLVGWRREAMEKFLDRPVDRPSDWIAAFLHRDLPCYAYNPNVVLHDNNVSSTIWV